MTNFPPETYLAAAAICGFAPIFDNDGKTVMCERYNWAGTFVNRTPFDPKYEDYRALREALDKEFGIMIYWVDNSWTSSGLCEIGEITDDDITTLMLRNVAALIEAGVLQEADNGK